MKRKNEGQKSMDLEKPVALTDEEVARRNDEIRGLIRANKGLRREMSDATRAGKKSIKENDERIDVLMEQIDQGIELRKQGTLFAKDQAQRALHDVAQKVDPVIAGGNGGAKPKPSDPHPFESGPRGETKECALCGGDLSDPIHSGGEPEAPVDIAKARRAKRGLPKGPLRRKREAGA